MNLRIVTVLATLALTLSAHAETAVTLTGVHLCCKSCVKDFKKNPDKYVKMVKDAKK